MPESLYIIDVSSIVFQVFHAIPEMVGRRGQPTNAVFGFTRDLFNIIRGKKPEYIIAAVDAEGPAERVAMYAEYKANRSEMPDNLRPQIPIVMDVMDAFGLCKIEHAGWEADDVIATCVEEALKRDIDVTVVSPDKDIRQLLAPRVRIYQVRKDVFLGEAELLTDWGIRPDQVVDYQSLVGDSVDNVPGVPQIGPKTASALLQQFDTLDEILAHADEVKQARVRENLKTYKDQALLSRELVRLRRDLPLTIDWECAKVGRYNVPKMVELFQDLNFRRFTDDARALAPKELKPRTRKASQTASLFAEEDLELDNASERKPKRPLTFYLVDTESEFDLFLSRLRCQKMFALDLETTDIDPVRAEIVGWALSWEPHVGYYIPVRGPEGATLLDNQMVLERLKPILENPDAVVVNQNIKYDLLVLKRNGVRIANIGLDPMVGHYLLDAGARTHNLDELAKSYFGHTMIPIADLIGRGTAQKCMDRVDVKKCAEYAAEDAEIAFSLAERLEPELRRDNLWDLYWDLERPLIEVLADMQGHGVRLNVPLLRDLSEEAAVQLEAIKREIYELAGRQFNLDSPKQLQEILFKDLKLPTRRRTGTGDSSTSHDVLEELATQHELPRKMLEHRKLSKLKGTYLDALATLVNPQTGRIHTSFNQVVAATGRLSSSDPNLQNIPIRTDEGRRIREAFIAEPGQILLCADYSQIELRMLAHFSQDPALMAAFASGADIHTAVASQVYNVPAEGVTSDMRRVAKAVNFGVVYGQSPYGLAMNLGISKGEAADFIEEYFTKYAGVDTWLQQVLKECDRVRYATTILGRKRAIEGIRNYGGRQRNLAERTAINTVVQGSAADLIKQAMLHIHNRLQRENHPAKMLLQIHDELVFETPADCVDDLAEIVRHEMEHALPLSVPIKVDITRGPNWLDQR